MTLRDAFLFNCLSPNCRCLLIFESLLMPLCKTVPIFALRKKGESENSVCFAVSELTEAAHIQSGEGGTAKLLPWKPLSISASSHLSFELCLSIFASSQFVLCTL